MLRLKKIYRSPPNSGKAILGLTLPSLLAEKSDRPPNDRAFNQRTEAGWQPLSEQAFITAAEEIALGLLNLPLEKGDRVALLMHSDVNFCLVDMGCLLANLIDVPIDLSQTLENIVFALGHSEAKAIAISNLDLLDQIVPYLQNVPSLRIVIVAEEGEKKAEGRGVQAGEDTSPVSPFRWQMAEGGMKEEGEAVGDKDDRIEDLATTGLSIPQYLRQSKHEPSHREVPPCLQIFSLDEIRAQGQTQNAQTHKQQLRSQQPDEVVTIIYIPGSTGQLQGVMLTHENLSINALAAFSGLPDLKLGAEEVVLSFLPLTHVFARTLLYGHMNYGHSIYFSNANQVIKHLQEVQPTLFATVPLLLEKVYSQIIEGDSKRAKRLANLRNKKRRETDAAGRKSWRSSLSLHFFKSRDRLQFLEQMLTPIVVRWALNLARRYELGRQPTGLYALQLKLAERLVFSKWRAAFGGRLKYLLSGGAALKAEITNLFAAAGITILQGYGLTETSAAIACNRNSFKRAGTVGVPMAGVEIAIAEDGEILVRGACVTQGYYKNPEATQKVLEPDGWFHTGDLGEFTEDGFLKITGLKKSLFKLSTGKYVTPQPLESKLEKSPLVAKAIAVGAERKFCAMLIFPNLETLQERAKNIELDLPPEELLKHPCILAIYQSLVDEANCHLPYWSTVKRFQLLNATLTVENGMLTPTGEVMRAQVVEAFAKEIDALYQEETTKRKGNKEMQNLDEPPIDEFPCPPIATATCPVYAQSLKALGTSH